MNCLRLLPLVIYVALVQQVLLQAVVHGIGLVPESAVAQRLLVALNWTIVGVK